MHEHGGIPIKLYLQKQRWAALALRLQFACFCGSNQMLNNELELFYHVLDLMKQMVLVT